MPEPESEAVLEAGDSPLRRGGKDDAPVRAFLRPTTACSRPDRAGPGLPLAHIEAGIAPRSQGSCMTTDADKEPLIHQYAAAVAEERSTWHLWQDPGLTEAERARAYERWTDAAERMRTLALRLTAGPSEPPSPGNAE